MAKAKKTRVAQEVNTIDTRIRILLAEKAKLQSSSSSPAAATGSAAKKGKTKASPSTPEEDCEPPVDEDDMRFEDEVEDDDTFKPDEDDEDPDAEEEAEDEEEAPPPPPKQRALKKKAQPASKKLERAVSDDETEKPSKKTACASSTKKTGDVVDIKGVLYDAKSKKIERPKGEAGRGADASKAGFNLIRAMGLDTDELRPQYFAYRSFASHLANVYLDPAVVYNKQEHLQIAACLSMFDKKFPLFEKVYLRRWPANQFLQDALALMRERHRAAIEEVDPRNKAFMKGKFKEQANGDGEEDGAAAGRTWKDDVLPREKPPKATTAKAGKTAVSLKAATAAASASGSKSAALSGDKTKKPAPKKKAPKKAPAPPDNDDDADTGEDNKENDAEKENTKPRTRKRTAGELDSGDEPAQKRVRPSRMRAKEITVPESLKGKQIEIE